MKNKKLRKSFKDKPCLVCGKLGSDFCHIKSYATTLSDSEDNAMPLCRQHHTEQGQIGIVTFCFKYSSVMKWMNDLDFEVCNVFGISKLMKRKV